MKSTLVIFTLGLFLSTFAQADTIVKGEVTGHKEAKLEKKSKADELRDRLKGYSSGVRF